jgi:hypothetical protein
MYISLLYVMTQLLNSITRHHMFVCLSLFLLVTSNARWAQHGIAVASGHYKGLGLQELWSPHSLVVDDDGTVFIANFGNHRIVAWEKDDNEFHVGASGQGQGNGLHQLCHAIDVLIDKETNSLIICDRGNRRVVRWPPEE